MRLIIFVFIEVYWKVVSEFFLDAVKLGDVGTVDQLLQCGLPVHMSDEGGWTALHWAVAYNHTDIAKRLLQAGADVNRQTLHQSNTPLHLAVEFNSNEVALLLVDKGADITLKNDDMETPLDWACDETKSLLLELQQSVT